MALQQIIDQTIHWVKNHFALECSGHDWWHIWRVYRMSLYLQKDEGGDEFIISLAALLHDIGDHKFHNGIDKSRDIIYPYLKQFPCLQEADIEHVITICENISFRGALVEDNMPTLEGKIVQDADRLDALGAIGIARTFATGGKMGKIIYDPDIPPVFHKNWDEYKKHQNTSINHFYEKLLILKDRMHTSTARRIAEQRTAFMQTFIDQFFLEWNMKDFSMGD